MKKLIYMLLAGCFALSFASVAQADTICSTATGGADPASLIVTLNADPQEYAQICAESLKYTQNGASELEATMVAGVPQGFVSGLSSGTPDVDFLDTGTNQRVLGAEYSILATTAHLPAANTISINLTEGASATTGRTLDIDFSGASAVSTVAGMNDLDVATPLTILAAGAVNQDHCGLNYAAGCSTAGQAALDRVNSLYLEATDPSTTTITGQTEITLNIN